MLKKSFALFALSTMAIAGSAFGQSCGTDFEGGCGGGSTNCGREISSADAAGLWAGYCTESCFDFSCKRQRGLKGGCGGGCGGGDCFGYASNNCGTCDSGMSGGRARRLGGKGGDCGCEDSQSGRRLFGGCKSGKSNCFGYSSGGCGNCAGDCGDGSDCGDCGGSQGKQGCGLFKPGRGRNGGYCGRSEGRMFRFLTGGNRPGLFSRSAADCGNTDAYFNEAVGYEYGTAGMASSVAGCGTDFAPGAGGGSAVDTNQGSAQPADGGLMSPPQEPVSNVVPSTTEPASEN